MLRSVASVYGAAVLTVVLTGMGQDGLLGGRKIIESGGTIIAQDKETSVVWGMPGAVAINGLCSAVLPLKAMAGHILSLITGRK
jgi:two-component system chemotaxis response regulator CheB